MPKYPGLETIDQMQDIPTFLLQEVRQPTPEKRLAAAVFGVAIEDLMRGDRGAREWVSSDDASGPHSFASLCELFDFDVDAVREALLTAKPQVITVGVRTRSRDATRAVVRRVAKGRRPSWWSGDRVPRSA